MKRREFITLLGGSAAASQLWPHHARAQQPAMPVIGVLSGVAPEAWTDNMAAFSRGLKETGYVEGQNLRIEQRWARGQLDQLPALVADLIGRRVSVLMTTGGTIAAIVAKKTGTTIPIVFTLATDPVEDGLVASMNRPGGTITGVTFFSNLLLAKRLEILRDLVPKAALFAALVNPNNPRAAGDTRDIEAAAASHGSESADPARRHARRGGCELRDHGQRRRRRVAGRGRCLLPSRRQQLAVLAARHAIPASYPNRDFVVAGGLISYGANLADSLSSSRRLRGTNPQGRQARGPAGAAADQVRSRDQPAHRQGARPRHPGAVLALADEVIE